MSAQSSPLLTKSSSANVPDPDDEEVKSSDFKSKVYATRWLVLTVFFLHVLYTNLAWSNVDSIADLAECYYNVDVFWINSLSYLFYVTYVLFFVLATWFLGRFGLRWAAIVSGCFGAVGAWIKFAGVGPQYFWLLLPGQALASIPNIIEWSAPALISAVWFPPNERAMATTLIGAISPQSGILISLVVGPLVLKNPMTTTVCNATSLDRGSFAFVEWQEEIYQKMFYYVLGQAIFATLLVPLSFMVPSAPPSPPSVSKHIEDGMKKMNILQSIVALLKNINYVVFLLIFGILLGVSGVYVTVYEEALSHSGYQQYAGTDMSYLGLSIQAAAIVILLVIGKWIDWTKSFHLSAVIVCICSTVMAIGLAVCVLFQLHFYVVCALCTLTVAFVVAFQAIAYEFGVEMTFPVPEGVSVSVLNAFSQFVATVMTLIASAMIKTKAVYVFFFLGGCLGLAVLLQIFVNPKLRRVELDSSSATKFNIDCSKIFRSNKNLTVQAEAQD